MELDNKTYKIAMVGSKDQILGFKALGLKTITANSAEEAREALFRLNGETVNLNNESRKKYAIIFMTEELAMQISKEDYKKLTKEALPAIIPVPGIKGTTGFGLSRIKKMVEQAVGSDIFK
ncbi:V-type ATP synthase subunit F [Candidatus Peregrinibacteria bacterium]|nr:V-type ATP synthase subunit F [Candidatus Peregrinibacteria bacterium]